MRIMMAVLVMCAACTNKLSSDVEVNGKKVKLSSCRNGSVHGFRGVELTAEDGTRLRIASTITGDSEVVVMPSGSDRGISMGKCGVFSISDQNSTVNSVKNVEGKATLDCTADGMTLKGTATFENCH